MYGVGGMPAGMPVGLGGIGGMGGYNTGLGGNERAPLQDGNSLSNVPEEVRRGFVSKVYGILGIQLTLTTLVTAGVVYKGPNLSKEHPTLGMALLFMSIATSLTMMFVFLCCRDTMRRAPLNYFLLLLFTVAKGILLGFISAQFTKVSVLVAVAITTLVVIALTFMACCAPMDVTGYAPYMGSAIMVLCGFGFFVCLAGMFGLGSSPAFQFLPMIYAAMGAMVFSAYLVFDTQLILGGRHHKYEFGIDDYAMAAISIYTDIVEMFVFVLQVVGKRNDGQTS